MINESEKANELNNFYKRFDSDAETNIEKCEDLLGTLVYADDRIIIDNEDVTKVFKKLNIKKACGPDGISAFMLKTFAEELTPAWSPLYQLSVDTGEIPRLWTSAIIIPIPKKSCLQENSDFRPVALTSAVMKSFECIMVRKVRDEVQDLLDP